MLLELFFSGEKFIFWLNLFYFFVLLKKDNVGVVLLYKKENKSVMKIKYCNVFV